MDCYFGSLEPARDGLRGKDSLVCFSIPSAGISFKAPFKSEERLHTEYASLLTLLEFIELNQKLFKGKKLQIYGHDLEIIGQINGNRTVQHEFTELLKKALDYKDKYQYSLGWIPQSDNPSINYLFD